MILVEQLSNLKPLTLLYRNENSRIYKTNDGRLLKQVSGHILKVNASYGISYEEKILYADEIVRMKKIAKPLTAIYNGDVFIGYTMYPILGVNCKKYYATQSIQDSCNLYLHAYLYKQLEAIVKEGNEQNMVFPDVCNGDNTLIDEKDSVSLFDFDGMQYDKYGSISLTESLFQDIENKAKYFITPPVFYTSEVDKLSLLRFYFFAVFPVRLHSLDKSIISLKNLFDILGFVEEEQLFNKVEATLSDCKKGLF